MSDDLGRMDALERAVANMIRVGVVKTVSGNTAVVTIGGNETAPLVWMNKRAHDDFEWDPPDIGEQAVVLAPGGLLEDAFIAGFLPRDKYTSPSSNPEEHVRRYANGDTIVHNNASGDLTIVVKGTYKVLAGKIELN